MLSKIVKLLPNKITLILVSTVGILLFSNYQTMKMFKKASKESKINAENTITLANSFGKKFDTLQMSNGKMLNRIQALNINANSLKDINSNLTNKIKALNLKIDKLESVTDIGIDTKINIDTLRTTLISEIGKLKPIQIKNSQLYSFNKKDKFINLNGNLRVFKEFDSIPPIITDFKLKSIDSLLIAPQIEYKRLWWTLWIAKRATGMKLNVNSASPYSEIQYIEHYNFKDLK